MTQTETKHRYHHLNSVEILFQVVARLTCNAHNVHGSNGTCIIICSKRVLFLSSGNCCEAFASVLQLQNRNVSWIHSPKHITHSILFIIIFAHFAKAKQIKSKLGQNQNFKHEIMRSSIATGMMKRAWKLSYRFDVYQVCSDSNGTSAFLLNNTNSFRSLYNIATLYTYSLVWPHQTALMHSVIIEVKSNCSVNICSLPNLLNKNVLICFLLLLFRRRIKNNFFHCMEFNKR